MLPVMHRVVTPASALHLGGRAWPGNNLRTNSLSVAVRQDALLSVLPGFARKLDGWTYDTDTLIDQFILDSPELWPHTRWNPLDGDDFRQVYHWIIRAQSRSSYGEVDVMVGEGLIESLERSYQYDRTSVVVGSEQFFHRRTQRLFRSLAEVSRQTESLRIGGVLATWFMTHATQIATTDSSMALGQWCYAIMRASMRETDRRVCLLKILQGRPDLATRLVGRGQKAEEVARSLQITERLSVRRDVGVGRLGLRTDDILLRPRADDLLLGVDYPDLVDRSRSRSHDRGLLSPLGGLGGIGGIGRGAGVLEISGGGRAERALMAQEDITRQERRMLHLTMGSRYADRFDRREPVGLGGLGGLGGLAIDDGFRGLRDGIEDGMLI